MRRLAPLLLALALGCGHERPPDPLLEEREPSAKQKECLERAEVRAYLEDVRQRTLAHWQPPPDASKQTIVVLLILKPNGEIGASMVPDAHSQQIEDSMLEALRAAAPFPKMDERTVCLTAYTVRGTFSVR